MKKGKLLVAALLAAAAASTSAFAVACTTDDNHTHTWGDWVITTKPTQDAAGEAKHECTQNDGGIETLPLPALSDTDFWAYDPSASTEATHTTAGKSVYKNEEYDLTVETEVAKTTTHEYGKWHITKQPTQTETGTAERECTANDDTDTKELPNLADSDFWTLDTQNSTPVTHEADGKNLYTNAEYELTAEEIIPTNGHTWGAKWTLTKDPTETVKGSATHACTEHTDVTETVDVPELSDTTFWTKTTTPATHEGDGSDVYTNTEHGITVTVNLPATGHTWGKWTLTKDPTETETGTAERTCTEHPDKKETKDDVPALSDSDVWTEGEGKAEPDYEEGAYKLYTSEEYGEVKVYDPAKPKLVAPFANKTYYSININASEANFLNKNLTDAGSWIAASLALDANGEGDGHAYPFSNGSHYKFSVVDAATGKISIEITDDEGSSTKTAYCDFETGVIVMPDEDFSEVNVLILSQFSKDGGDSLSASGFLVDDEEFKLAISYTLGGKDNNILINGKTGEAVYFGVDFKDIAGEALKGGQAYNATSFYAYKGEDKIAAYGYNGEKVVTLDGYEGTYTITSITQGEDVKQNPGTVVLSGFGTVTITIDDAPHNGTYQIIDGGDYDILLVFTDDMTISYELVFGEKNTVTLTVPAIQITFDLNGKSDQVMDAVDAYTGAAVELPDPEEIDGFLFKGWYLDQDCTQPAANDDGDYVFTGATKVYAKWVEAITVTIVAEYNGDGVNLKVAVGDAWADILSTYITEEIDEENGVYFTGWLLSLGDASNPVSPDLQVFAAQNGATFTAQWTALPAYYGDYKGHEIFNAEYGTTSKSFSIDVYGKITGGYTGTVTDYSKDTGIITWTNSSNKPSYFFFDEATGIIAVNYNNATNNYAGSDMYLVSKNFGDANGKFDDHYGINATARGADASSTRGYYAQFVTVPVEGGTKLVLIYYNFIYSDIKVTDGSGTTVFTTAAQIKNSKTVLVYDNVTKAYVLAVGSTGESFGKQSATKDLDLLQGVYTASGEYEGTINLDGMGTITMGDQSGTYTVAEDEEYTISAFVGEDEALTYYEITITEKTANVVKPMVTITFTTQYGEFTATKSYNKNVQVKIDPVADVSGHVFRGWFKAEDFAANSALEYDTESGKYLYTPVSEATLHAKWLTEYTLTLHYNQANVEEQDVVLHYGENEVADIARPAKDGKKFGGWYKNAGDGTYSEENLWVSGSEMTASVEVWAKWDEPPVYSGTYKLYYLDGDTVNGAVETPTTYTGSVVIDPEGNAPQTSGTAYPFCNNNLQVQEYDAATGKLTFLRVSNTSTFTSYIDVSSGIIVFICRGSDFSDMLVMVPADFADGATFTNSYWNSGKTRLVTVAKGEVSHNIYLDVDKAYFNVKFASDKRGATPVAAEAGYNAGSLYILSSTNEILGSFGYNGTTMTTRDGLEGTYTKNGDSAEDLGSLVISGVKAVTFGTDKEGEYTIIDKSAGTIGVYEVAEGKKVTYYDVTLNAADGTYTATKTMVTVVFNSAYGFASDGDKTKQYNKNIPITLPKLEDDANIFNGWFKDAEYGTVLSLNADGTFTPVDATTTIYVQWLEKLTVNVVWGKDGIELATEYFVGKGNTFTLELPGYTDGQVVEGLYTDAGHQTAWTNGSKVEAGLTIYVNWKDAVPMYGSWKGTEIWGGNADPGNTGYGGTSNNTVTVDAEGNFTGENRGTVAGYDEATGMFKVGNYPAAIDVKNGVMVIDNSSNSKNNDFSSDIHLYVLNAPSTVSHDKTQGSQWNKGTIRLLTLKWTEGTMDVLVYNNRVWGKVTLSEGVTTGNAYSKEAFTVYDSEGNVIANFKLQDKTLIGTDGYENDYAKGDGSTADLGTITLDGMGKATFAGAKTGEGTYAIEDAASSKIGVYVTAEGVITEYYEVTLNTSAKTYTATKPMVTVTYTITGEGGLTEAAKEVNKNVPYALPVTQNDTHVTDGWFTDEDCANPVTLTEDGLYVPTGTVTLYAQAKEKITITIVYNAGGHSTKENVSFAIASGKTPNLTPYVPKDKAENDGYSFLGWFEDEDFSIPYVPKAETANKTIYCGWTDIQFEIEAPLTSGTYKWAETEEGSGIWKAVNSKSNGNFSLILKITFKTSGTFSFDYAASFSDNYDGVSAALNKEVPHQSGDLVMGSKYNGSGTINVTVKAGDVLYIDAFWDSSSSSPSDYAQISNLKLSA